ncbi:hypothetical protein BGY98DRAFT_1119914 [Russula aff. rugulosa BPL654]|nr:hypothetical protein BGY98DRAFT_1119914 [Russula aff. rugulosa BPL654]
MTPDPHPPKRNIPDVRTQPAYQFSNPAGLPKHFCPPLTLSTFILGIFLIPATFHPRRWLEKLELGLESPLSRPVQQETPRPPPTRAALPALTDLQFRGLVLPEAFIPAVEHLYIYEIIFATRWQDDIEDSQWLEVLHPFTAVKYLYLSREFTSRMAPALQELAGEVLPSLQNLFLEDLLSSGGPVQGAIGKFVVARQLAVSYWDREQQEWSRR